MRPPVARFTEETGRQKVQAAEDAWSTRDPAKVAAAYSEDSRCRILGPRPQDERGASFPLA
jgi:nuclear transport factor 2 (NTF2) superfamily protein